MHLRKTGLLFMILCFLFYFASYAQDSNYVKWNCTAKKISDNLYELHLKATVSKDWHFYIKDGQLDGVAGFKISFTDSAIQKQGDAQFIGNKKTISDKIFDNKPADVFDGEAEVIQKIKFSSAPPSVLSFGLSYFVENTESSNPDDYKFYPEDPTVSVKLQGGIDLSASNRIIIPTIDLKNPVNNCGGITAMDSLWKIFLLGLIGGLLSLFTPCVFPMIPLTVSLFTKKSGSRSKGIGNASLYGFFIFLIYILLSVPFYFLPQGNAEILNNISTNPWLNILFFAVFVFFAFSFFGYYEITLPDRFATKADSKATIENIGGVFFMALTLAIVSFSCTGPLLGALLANSLDQHGKPIELTVAMGGFGIAFGLPFALFAMFPNWLTRLPKSGGWLHSFKVVLGFLELAFAIKFLSNADLVEHWGILKREIYIGIWIIIGIFLMLYLLGKIEFPHFQKAKKVTKGKIALAGITGVIILYLMWGLTPWGNLKLISGFPPPTFYSIFPDKSECMLGLNCTHDYEEGLKKARTENKPILLDFTGYACTNCRRMEENVWSQTEVNDIMREKYIVVSLYVDDKSKLPSAKQFLYTTSDGTKKNIVTVGDKWATFETENFGNNAQPFYVIISKDEKLLTNPVGYTPDPNEYKKWLECGVAASLK